MKKSFLLLLTAAALAFPSKAVDYTFTYKGAQYDFIDYLSLEFGSKAKKKIYDAYLSQIEPEAVNAGVFHLPLRIDSEMEGIVGEVKEVRLWSFPSSIKKFTVNADNPYFTAVDGVIYSKDMTRLVAVPHDKAASLKIPSTVKVIGHGAFANSDLTKIVIPEGVTSIEDNAFGGCKKLAKVQFPSTITHVGYLAFSETPFEDKLPAGMNYLGKVAFRYVGTMPAGHTLTIREGTVEIAERAVTGQKGLASVVVPTSVKRIGQYAFEGCENIKSVATLASDCHVGQEAFTDAKWGIDVEFEGDRSRYHNAGDNVIIASGFSTMHGIDTLPRFKSIVEANKSLPSGEHFDADIEEIRFYEGGSSLSDMSPRAPKKSFSIYFGHESNSVYSIRTAKYKAARAAAKSLYGIYYVRFLIDKKGNVSNVSVPVVSTFRPDKKAILALINALPPFEPARLKGRPVDAWVNILVTAEPIAGGFLYTYPD